MSGRVALLNRLRSRLGRVLVQQSSSKGSLLEPAVIPLSADCQHPLEAVSCEQLRQSSFRSSSTGLSTLAHQVLSGELGSLPDRSLWQSVPARRDLSAEAVAVEEDEDDEESSRYRHTTEPLTEEEQLERAGTRNGFAVMGQVEGHAEIKHKKVFAIVQVGSHQFKVVPDDVIYTEKLIGTDINDKLELNKVLLLGSAARTVIGRPYVPEAKLIAAVEEQFLDGKVLIFKKRRRKNSRRLKGHRQELTRLRILEIVGLEEAPAKAEQQQKGSPKEEQKQRGRSAYAFQPRPLPQSHDLKHKRRSPAVPGHYTIPPKKRDRFRED